MAYKINSKSITKNVGEVRKYIDKIDGFKKVTVLKRENWYMKFVKRFINGPMTGSNNVDRLLFFHPRKVNVDSKLIDIYTYHLEDRWRENDIKINNDYFFEPIWKAEY